DVSGDLGEGSLSVLRRGVFSSWCTELDLDTSDISSSSGGEVSNVSEQSLRLVSSKSPRTPAVFEAGVLLTRRPICSSGAMAMDAGQPSRASPTASRGEAIPCWSLPLLFALRGPTLASPLEELSVLKRGPSFLSLAVFPSAS
ncbi:hypothetical protein EGW08_007612, partial [Elysia chlorotica]